MCKEKRNNPEPLAAYQREYEGLRARGIADPNPSQQILDDFTVEIDQCRAKGYRPVLMMGANGDPYDSDKPDKQLLEFFEKPNCGTHTEKNTQGK